MQMQISSVPLLTARTAATPKPAGTLVSARFTRRRSNEPRQAGHQGQGPDDLPAGFHCPVAW